MKRRHSFLISLVVVLQLVPLTSCNLLTTESFAERAQRLHSQNDLQGAIDSYQRHIQERLKTQARPTWENPYFYLLLIADLELERGDAERAVEACLKAKEMGVDDGLVSDRYRSIANWYIERGELEVAFEHLKRFRQSDPLLFDALLDRVGREITKKEVPLKALATPNNSISP